MPINLDSCITGIFIPGNIGASSGQPPIVRVMPPRVPAEFDVAIIELANAIDLADQNTVTAGIIEVATAADVVGTPNIVAADISEAVTATDTQDGTVGIPPVARSAMVEGVFVNSDGTAREANANGIMVNL